jgi:two-component system, NtrC family, sensor kinase
VQCYPGLLNQVFMNLLVNAIHAIQETKFERADSHSITIQTLYSQKTDLITITISDTGKGISPDNLTKVFDPGFTTKGVGVGTGLGLALCYRIVEKHHGRISLESVMNQGTSFHVQIPAHAPVAHS